MACIFKRGKTWSYSVDIGRDETGKRKKKGKGGFRTQKEAKEAAAILEAEIASAIFLDEKKILFKDFTKQWLEDYALTIRPATLRLRKLDTEKLNNYFGNSQLKDITQIQYKKFITEMFKKGYADSTLQGMNNTANLIFKKACEYKIIKSSPTEHVKIPKKPITVQDLENDADLPKYLEKEELNLFIKTAKDTFCHAEYLMFLILAYTGMRRGELLGLTWDNIDFENSIIKIRKTVDTNTTSVKKYTLGPPKTKRSKRDILVTKEIMRELSKHKVNQKKLKIVHRLEWHDGNFVFTSKRVHGYPVSGIILKNNMKKILKIANLNLALSPHSLRHTHTSLLAEADVPLEAIMERLGHAEDKVTKLIYLHVTKNVKKDTIQKFQKLMNSI